ncbi:MMPL family transporter [Actinomadura graeca]|uniref:MMPL family transporter n=1 Tax=Actinomadura graeca TaxID=2750812 RepID=A0ABX8R252_9ACTN|nr:MMPL family transporter [Actinomadura graeca]QXJ25139.1 MMPL family transporter [Actinomadura graeca]
MFGGLARFVVRRRWWVIAAWVVAAVLLTGFAPRFKASSEQTDFLPGSYESVRAFDLTREAFPQTRGQNAIVAVTRSDGGALTPADQAVTARLARTLEDERPRGVQQVLPGPVSPNREVEMINARFTSESFDDPDVAKGIDEMRDTLAEGTRGTGLTARVTGNAAINADAQESYERSDSITLGATVVVIFVLLIFTFRSVVAAFLPLLTVGLVMMVALALIGSVNAAFDLKGDSLTQSLMPIVLFGVGTDYILFLLFRYRERLRAGEDGKTAMVSAVERVGEVIASAACAVIVAFSALILASLGMLKSMGPAMGIAVATTLVAALTLIPAVVSLLGSKVFWPSKSWRAEPPHRKAARLGGFIGRSPWQVALVSGAVLVALSVCALGFSANFNMASAPAGTEAAKGLDDLEKGFPAGVQEATQVFVTGTGGGPLPPGAAETVAARLRTTKGVAVVEPPERGAGGRTALVNVQLADDPLSKAAMKTVSGPVRDTAHASGPPGTEVIVGGQTAVMVDLQKAMNRDYRVVFPIAGLLIAIILGVLLRSVVAPVYLMIAVVLSFLGTIGASVALFQWGEGHTGVIFFLPLIVYLFVTALGTDYNILVIARLREEARAGHPPRRGVGHAFEQAAPTVASAGLILAGSFATFLLAEADAMQEMGTTVALGVILAAFVMSMFLVPAVTVLLGHAAWWPGHQDTVRASAAGPAPGAGDPATARGGPGADDPR